MRKILYYRKKFDLSRAPAWDGASEAFDVTALDGVRIAGSRLEGEGDGAFLVVHGLLAHHRAPGFKEFAESLRRFGPVFAIDLRGHGGSSGVCTFGVREALDVAGAVRRIRRESGLPLVVVGFSMGAAAAVRAAAVYEPADAVVAVSCPARWRGGRRWAALRTSLAWKAPGGTALVRLITGVRLNREWEDGESPASVVCKIAPSPVLIVHGTADSFFPPTEAEELFAEAGERKALWIVEGGGHAEGLFMKPGAPVEGESVDSFVGEIVGRVRTLFAAE